ncbi:MAG TPA: acyloxyacyl hydrolase [Chthoniobacteraceae bacterium]|nr:acyloxyacyl hydrolase [Chthoniobacteraceae bacterium]
MNKTLLWSVLALALFGTLSAFAGDDISNASKEQIPINPPQKPLFRAGAKEVDILSGALFSISGNQPKRPALNYAFEAIDFGLMLNDVHGNAFLRGNDELLLEGFGGEVFTGPGRGLGGGSLILRHNFVQDGSRFVPFIQLGGGGLDNDIYRDQVQRRIGERFEFTLHGDLGVRWLVNDRWGITAEAEYRHISNAGLSHRNGGLDSLGALLGVNIFF